MPGGYGFVARYDMLRPPPPPPWHDIEVRFFVVGEERIWKQTMTASGGGLYRVTLRPSAMEKVKERLSRSDVWGLKKGGRDKKSGVWRVQVSILQPNSQILWQRFSKEV
jgi:hypothetical protein